ncbi:glycosyltransferase [Candidatus Parcubacteria bacterium]|nr:MAG: glycosyltransferase [Candidatus Parcubacteria bacterium]
MKRANESRLRICFVSLFCYPLFNPSSTGQFGGSEVRVAQIARNLARVKAFDVSVLVFDHGQSHIEVIDDIAIYSWRERPAPSLHDLTQMRSLSIVFQGLLKMERLGERLRRVLRGGMNKWRARVLPVERGIPYLIDVRPLAVYDEIDADVYVLPGNSVYSAELAYYCSRTAARYVFLAGSDMDYDPDYKAHPRRRDIYGSLYALKAYAIEHADHHVVQNHHQAELLRRYYGRDSTLIRNPIDLQPRFPRDPAPRSILWVGKSDERVKQPSVVVRLARQLPAYEFTMVMPMTVRETHEQILAAAEQLPNLTIVEGVPFDQIEAYFARARLHINTSRFEGFPNTFLQAAKYGVPTLSLRVDPDGMLSRHGCGTACEGDMNRMRAEIIRYMEDDALCDQVGERALHYVRKYHDMEVIIPQYIALFETLLAAD